MENWSSEGKPNIGYIAPKMEKRSSDGQTDNEISGSKNGKKKL